MLAPARLVNGAVDDPSNRVTDLAYRDVEVVDGHDVRPIVGTAGAPEQPTDLKCPSRDRRAAAFEREAARRYLAHTYASLSAPLRQVNSRGAPLIAELSSGLDCLTWSVDQHPCRLLSGPPS